MFSLPPERSGKEYNSVIYKYRKKWKLPKLRGSDLLFAQSELAQISQQTAAFDFPRVNLPPSLLDCL